jgi:prophage DNA circulation protein
LPSIKTIIPERTTISLLLAYDLNESIENEQDIIDRNAIRHPGFIPAKDPLEVISGN